MEQHGCGWICQWKAPNFGGKIERMNNSSLRETAILFKWARKGRLLKLGWNFWKAQFALAYVVGEIESVTTFNKRYVVVLNFFPKRVNLKISEIIDFNRPVKKDKVCFKIITKTLKIYLGNNKQLLINY